MALTKDKSREAYADMGLALCGAIGAVPGAQFSEIAHHKDLACEILRDILITIERGEDVTAFINQDIKGFKEVAEWEYADD